MTTNTIHRSRCIVRQTGSDSYQLISYQGGINDCELDNCGIWIWALLSDRMEMNALVTQTVKQFPNLSVGDATSEINKLMEKGILIKQSESQIRSSSNASRIQRIANLNIYLTDSLTASIFGKPLQSYLMYLLWYICDTVTIVDDANLADIIFCSRLAESQLDNADVIRILISNNPKKNELNQVDYIISAQEAQCPYHTKWLRIPNEAFNPEFDLLAQLDAVNTVSGYNIERLAQKLLRFLVGSSEIITKAPDQGKPFLTIGMTTENDYDGIYSSITSLVIHHSEILEKSEIIILDRNSKGETEPDLKTLADKISNVRYIPCSDINSTAARDMIFKVAKGKWVACMDSHVMMPPNTLRRLTNYMEKNPNSNDLLQGPQLNEEGSFLGSHLKSEWQSGMYGVSDWDERANNTENEAFEIQMQDLGLFACRKEVWPGFNTLFSGHGREEGYMHQKFRNQGGKCLCLPFFQWTQRFAKPTETDHPINWLERIKNYYIGFDECGLATEQIATHFSDYLEPEIVKEAKQKAALLQNSPFHQFDHAVCINSGSDEQKWELMKARFKDLRISEKVKRFTAVATPEFHKIGQALSHRKIIEHARNFSYKHVLILEDNAQILSGAEIFLTRALEELDEKAWKILYLGGEHNRFKLNLDDSCQHLKKVSKFRLTGNYALVYNESVYDEVLDQLPSNEDDMAEWLVENYSLDQYLCQIESRYLVYPKLFTHPSLKDQEDEPYRYFYR